MQQYFTDEILKEGSEYVFTKEQAHHARDVVRLDHETVRLVDCEGTGWFGECEKRGNDFIAVIREKDPRINEAGIEITLAMALVRREKFELILQKAAELGATRIVPFEASRCIVHAKSEKADKQQKRYESIVLSAAEQCKRNRIPEICPVIPFAKLNEYKSDVSLAAYENASKESKHISDFDLKESVTVVIGPEGGFSDEEMEQLVSYGYEPVTLGSRILRAETAAIYACAVIAEVSEK